MIVAFYIPQLNIGGAERVIIDLLNNLSQDNTDTYILITDCYNSRWTNQLSNRITLKHIPSNQNWLKRIWSLRKLNNINNIDVLISHLTHSNLGALLSNIFNKRKVIVVEHSITSDYLKTLDYKKNIFKLFIKFMYPKADYVVSVSEATNRDLELILTIPDSNKKVIHNPVDIDHIKESSLVSINNNVKKFIGNRNVIGTLGRLSSIKRHYELINSIGDLLVKEDIVLLVIGYGEEFKNIKKLIQTKNLNNHVFVTGFTDNPYSLLNIINLYIHSSSFEGLGLAIIEAITLDKFIICTNFDGCEEIIIDNSLGQIIEDINDFTPAIISYFNEGSFRNKEHNNYKDLLLSKFSVEKSAISYKKLINK